MEVSVTVQTVIFLAVAASSVEFFIAGIACMFVQGMGLWSVLYTGLGVVNGTLAIISRGS